ncbi:MAG: Maltose/maltodextrin transporter, substrate binding periplasmic protein MalE, partial [Labilithrix sp.]|nr:Maltose/maltodextrin transporter, substrate binding periplasmic protein MalE [Labilithrix sp.]
MKYLRALVMVIAVVAILILPGCTEPPHGIVLWHPYRGGEEAALKKIAARFEAERGVKVTALAVPYEAYLSKLEAAIPRGNGPDVFVGPHNRLGEYLLHRLVAPVGDAFPEADVARYEPVTVTAVTHEGARYAVPLASKCVALYYNPLLLPEPPRTLEELVAKKDALGPGVWPLAYESQAAYYHAALLHAYGGKLFDTGFAMTGDAAERSLDKARELVATRVVPDEASGDLVKTLFATGKAAAVFSGPWLAGDLAERAPYEVAPLPSIDGVGPMRPFLTVDGVFMTPEGAKSAEARALARELGSDVSAFERAELGKQIVASKVYWAAPKNDRQHKLLASFHDASADAIPMPVSMAMNPVWVPAEQAIRKVLRGDASPKNALAEAKARYDDVMRTPGHESTSPAPLVVVLGLALLAAAFAIVRRVRAPGFRRELQTSKPAYKYVTHAAITILVLVVLPLVAGAATSFFAGTRDDARFVGLANYVEILS